MRIFTADTRPMCAIITGPSDQKDLLWCKCCRLLLDKGVLNTAFDHAEQWHGFMDGLSLHYYVHPEGWEIKGSSTDFDADVWYKTLSKALYMETLIERHGAIMDEYDPDKKSV